MTDDARLGRDCAGALRELSVGVLLATLATLALRVGPRRVDEGGGGATDCRLAGGGGLAAVLGLDATTLEGRALGVVVGGFGFGAAALGVEGGGGAGCDNIVAMLESRMNNPWPGGHVK